jgi:hypothetical protein
VILAIDQGTPALPVCELAAALRPAARYEPRMDAPEAERLVGEWRAAVRKVLG